MGNAFQLLRAECLKVFGDIKVYWLNYIFGNINVFFMFFGLFYAFSKNSQDALTKLLFLFSLMYWYFGDHAVNLISVLIEEEIEQGTLEQLLTTRTHLAVSLFFRIIAQILFDLCKGVFMFSLCMWAFGISFSTVLSLRFLAAVIIFFIGLLAMYGFGYLVAGLSLIYKQASSIASIASTLLLFFSGTTIDISAFPNVVQGLIKLFPFYWSNCLIENTLQLNVAGFSKNALMLALELILWICCGVLALNRCLGTVYEKGTTAAY